MKIREIVSEAPFIKTLKKMPGQIAQTVKAAPGTVKDFAVGAKQGVQNLLNKPDNISKLATDISTIGGGPGVIDYTKSDKQDDASFQELLNILSHKSLNKVVKKDAVAKAMMNMYQSDKQNPLDRQTFINAIKALSKTHKNIKPEQIYGSYKPVFKRFQITPQEITA